MSSEPPKLSEEDLRVLVEYIELLVEIDRKSDSNLLNGSFEE